MAQLMLINPRKRSARRRKASSAQLRALEKGRATRRRNAETAKSNPAPRRRRRSALRVHHAHTARRRRARHNPIGATGIVGNLIGAAEGAGGALAVNAIFNLLPLPVSMKTGLAMTVTKMGLAIAVGMVGKKVLGRTAGKMAEGAMTVAAYEALRDMLPAVVGGTATMSGLGYMSPGMIAGSYGGGQNMSVPNMPGFAGMGEYVSGMDSGGMGQYTY